mmetsp:Transcript_40471/g.128962  ORF Transcript_40471/g.128962 Transcript_40471/m.128962 type:complete len:225 (-) Transcript_40471:968-1642(-)
MRPPPLPANQCTRSRPSAWRMQRAPSPCTPATPASRRGCTGGSRAARAPRVSRILQILSWGAARNASSRGAGAPRRGGDRAGDRPPQQRQGRPCRGAQGREACRMRAGAQRCCQGAGRGAGPHPRPRHPRERERLPHQGPGPREPPAHHGCIDGEAHRPRGAGAAARGGALLQHRPGQQHQGAQPLHGHGRPGHPRGERQAPGLQRRRARAAARVGAPGRPLRA